MSISTLSRVPRRLQFSTQQSEGEKTGDSPRGVPLLRRHPHGQGAEGDRFFPHPGYFFSYGTTVPDFVDFRSERREVYLLRLPKWTPNLPYRDDFFGRREGLLPTGSYVKRSTALRICRSGQSVAGLSSKCQAIQGIRPEAAFEGPGPERVHELSLLQTLQQFLRPIRFAPDGATRFTLRWWCRFREGGPTHVYPRGRDCEGKAVFSHEAVEGETTVSA